MIRCVKSVMSDIFVKHSLSEPTVIVSIRGLHNSNRAECGVRLLFPRIVFPEWDRSAGDSLSALGICCQMRYNSPTYASGVVYRTLIVHRRRDYPCALKFARASLVWARCVKKRYDAHGVAIPFRAMKVAN